MGNAFVLFGTLKVEDADFQQALRNAHTGLEVVQRQLTATEQRAKQLGQTSAVSARGLEKIGEKAKESESKLRLMAGAFSRGEIGANKMRAALLNVEKTTTSMNSRLRDSHARLTDFSSKSSGVIGGLGAMRGLMAGAGLSAGALAYGVGRAAIEIDNWKNILTSATGSADAAAIKFKELNAVAQASPGVMTSMAISTFALLKPMQIAEPTINGLIQAFGRIKLSLPTADINAFAFNLNQLAVSFDKADFKQAVENFPRFGEIVKKAFDLKSAQDDIEGLIAELKKLKEAGKLTKETWLAGIAEGINKDPSLEKLKDTLGSKFEKLGEELQIVAAPVGHQVLGTLLKAITDAKTIESGFVKAHFGEIVMGAIRQMITGSAVPTVSPAALRGGTILGQEMAIGMKLGIQTGQSDVISAAISIATAAYSAAKEVLGISSPSKVFFAIGKDTAQGMIDGIAAMESSVHSAMAGLLDIRTIKGLGKKDAPGVEMLTGLINEITRFNVTSKLQEVQLDLTAGKYEKVNAKVKDAIILAAKRVDALKAEKEALDYVNEGIDKFGELWGDIVELPVQTAMEKLNETLADPQVIAGMAKMNAQLRERMLILMRMAALRSDDTRTNEDLGQGSGRDIQGGEGGGLSTTDWGTGDWRLDDIASGVPPPPTTTWDTFWKMMSERLDQFKSTLPSLKTALGENLVTVVSGIGDVFANAVANWDGTLKGFWKSLVQGFRQMVSQIVAELVRLMVIKAIMSIIGAAAGSIGGAVGGGTPMGSIGGELGGLGGMGGLGNRAMSTVGSIKDFVMPNMAFAGGMTGGASTFNNQKSETHNITVNMPPSQGAGPTKDQIERAVLSALQKSQMRNK